MRLRGPMTTTAEMSPTRTRALRASRTRLSRILEGLPIPPAIDTGRRPARAWVGDPKRQPPSRHGKRAVEVWGFTLVGWVTSGRRLFLSVARQGTGLVPVSLVPLLVVRLGNPECAGRLQLGGNGLHQVLLLCVPARIGEGELLVAEGENGRAVLRAPVGALAVAAGGVVRRPEDFEEVAIRDFLWVELDEYRLGVARPVRAHHLVAGVGDVSAGVTDGGGHNAGDLPEAVLDAPEAALRKDGQGISRLWAKGRAVPDATGLRADIERDHAVLLGR